MVKHYLLLGAGFSRNWGGWLAAEVFEYLLGCAQVDARPALRPLLWRHKNNGGFEAALAELQRAGNAVRPDLEAFQAAIAEMFNEMNAAYFDRLRFEFSDQIGSLVREFLVRFDAIFTLNQDLLLERRYMDGNIILTEPRKWNGAVLPGLRQLSPPNDIDPASWRNTRWQVQAEPYAAPRGEQPVYKLHGSSQWLDAAGSGMLVMGGGKNAAIKAQPLLTWYQNQFEAALNEQGARLMVIGYSFTDGHINQIIRAGAENGLRIFIVDPLGVDVLNPFGESVSAADVHRIGANASARQLRLFVDESNSAIARVEVLLAPHVIGASRRSLKEIFGGDRVEHAKLMRFFEP